MPTAFEIITRLLPEGSNPNSKGDLSEMPRWPPDLYAVAATVVSMSGCYAKLRYTFSNSEDCFFADGQSLDDIVQWGTELGLHKKTLGDALDPEIKASLQKLWEKLLSHNNGTIGDMDDELCDATMKLMLIADHAASGLGFVAWEGNYPYANLVFAEYSYLSENKKPLTLRYLPRSLCIMVPDSELCVQPKTMTAQVGCTLRSHSHHLALLPSATEVETNWLIAAREKDVPSNASPMFLPEARGGSKRASASGGPSSLNLLLVPFPFSINGASFRPGKNYLAREMVSVSDHATSHWKFFSLRQDWLRHHGHEITVAAIADFITTLIAIARTEVEVVHGVVLPEAALDLRRAKAVGELLGKENPDLDIFVSGAIDRSENAQSTNGVHARLYVQEDGTLAKLTEWFQSKHHRWKIEAGQIQRYNLGSQLDHNHYWWEDINIQDRMCAFYVLPGGMSLATLVCEDLARIDPVQSVIRAVGPNLLIVLLMDGPQLERRWSGRYATVLADDPGSAVLCLTSLGLIRRSEPTGARERSIGLWKGGEAVATELCLRAGCHAMLVTLSPSAETNFTLDGRSDLGSTYKLTLTAQRSLKHPSPPAWADVS